MKNWFVFEKATCAYTEQITEEKLQEIVRRIEADYPITYSWTKTQAGFTMNPQPGIKVEGRVYPVIVGTVENGQTTVCRSLGVFPEIWFVFMGLCEAATAFMWLVGEMNTPIMMIFPVVMAVVGYYIIKMGSHQDGKPILKCVMDVLQE